MAKYTINFSCGHGSYEEQLYGPEKDRQRKIAWLQSNKTCKACWLAAQKSKDASAPRLAHITADYRDLSVTVRIENGVDANKGALLEMGFEWSRDYRGGINEMFAMRDAPLALCRTHKFISTDETMAWVDGVKGEITPLGYAIKTDISRWISKCLTGFWRIVQPKLPRKRLSRQLTPLPRCQRGCKPCLMWLSPPGARPKPMAKFMAALGATLSMLAASRAG